MEIGLEIGQKLGMDEFTASNGRSYRIGRLTPYDACFLSMRIMNAIAETEGVSQNAEDGQTLDPKKILAIYSKFSRSELKELFDVAFSVVSKRMENGGYVPLIMNGAYTDTELSLEVSMTLFNRVIEQQVFQQDSKVT